MVGYADIPGDRTPEINWLRANPHRLHLGRIGFRLTRADGSAAAPSDLTEIRQTLDLWNGVIVSHFRFDGEPVDVETVCHPAMDGVGVRIRSPLVGTGRVAIEFRFPYGTGQTTAADWTKPDAHRTVRSQPYPDEARFARALDADTYHAAVRLGCRRDDGRRRPAHVRVVGGARFGDAHVHVGVYAEAGRGAPAWLRRHRVVGASALEPVLVHRRRHRPRRAAPIPAGANSSAASCCRSTSRPSSAPGTYPPQESGLTFNSWEGKFHLEMHWWHAAHFALWNRLPLLERSLPYYDAILPKAKATAARQGYTGARWPKMTSPTGDESPSSVGPFLVWQQPHPIFYAELVYRERRDRATLERFRDVVFETAEFMASFPAWDAQTQRFVLGPPLNCAQETYPKDRTTNCAFELSYWAWGLGTAQAWRERLGLPREARWDRVLRGLSAPVVSDGKYLFAETAPDTYANPRWRTDHPSVVAALGVLPGTGIDRGRDGAHLRLDLVELGLADDVGVGLPDDGDDRRARRQAGPRDRRAADGHAEERLPRERAQPPASRPDDLPAGQRRAALRHRDDGRRLGRRAGRERARLSARRTVGGEVGRVEEGAIDSSQ